MRNLKEVKQRRDTTKDKEYRAALDWVLESEVKRPKPLVDDDPIGDEWDNISSDEWKFFHQMGEKYIDALEKDALADRHFEEESVFIAAMSMLYGGKVWAYTSYLVKESAE